MFQDIFGFKVGDAVAKCQLCPTFSGTFQTSKPLHPATPTSPLDWPVWRWESRLGLNFSVKLSFFSFVTQLFMVLFVCNHVQLCECLLERLIDLDDSVSFRVAIIFPFETTVLPNRRCKWYGTFFQQWFHIGIHQTEDASCTSEINWTSLGLVDSKQLHQTTEAQLIRNKNVNLTSYRK